MTPEQEQALVAFRQTINKYEAALTMFTQSVSTYLGVFAARVSQIIDDNPEFFAELLERQLGPDGKPLGSDHDA